MPHCTYPSAGGAHIAYGESLSRGLAPPPRPLRGAVRYAEAEPHGLAFDYDPPLRGGGKVAFTPWLGPPPSSAFTPAAPFPPDRG